MVFGHFWHQSYKSTKILHNVCLHFARQDGQYGKKGEENHVVKRPKYQKPKDENMGRTKHLPKTFPVTLPHQPKR